MRLTNNDKVVINALHQDKGWGARKIVNFFPEKAWSLASVSRLLSRIRQQHGILRHAGSGRRTTISTPANVARVMNLCLSPIGHAGEHKSPREVQKMTGISRTTVRRILFKNNITVYKRFPVQKLTDQQRQRRLRCCEELLRRFPERQVQRIFFTDEKFFTLSKAINTQNNRVYSYAMLKKNVAPDNLYAECSHRSTGVMVALGISRNHKGRLFFVDVGETVNAEYYQQHILTEGYIPDMHNAFNNYNHVLIQDNAPPHRARSTLAFLQQQNVTVVLPDEWPAISPDLNPLDYSIWGLLEEKLYKTTIADVEELKQRLVHLWNSIPQQTVAAIVDQWRPRLHKCVEANGGHFQIHFS